MDLSKFSAKPAGGFHLDLLGRGSFGKAQIPDVPILQDGIVQTIPLLSSMLKAHRPDLGYNLC